MNDRWKQRPEHSTWGDWGDEDQLGRLNLLGPEQVKKGVAEVQEGRTFCLSLPLNLPGGNVLSPVRFPPTLRPVIRNDEPYFNYEWRKKNPDLNDVASDDAVLLFTQYSTQWDGFAHRGALFDADADGTPEPVYYNGYRAGIDVVHEENQPPAANALGIENMAAHGVQGRGVLVNLFDRFGESPRHEVDHDDLMSILREDQIEIERGDILCLWTGLDQMILRMNGNPDESVKRSCAVLNGRDQKLLDWIRDAGIAAIASDNLAVEAVGVPLPQTHGGTSLPLHEWCLFRLGVHLGELWWLAELAGYLKAHQRSRFLLTAPPLRLPGAAGSPVTPIATV